MHENYCNIILSYITSQQFYHYLKCYPSLYRKSVYECLHNGSDRFLSTKNYLGKENKHNLCK